MLRLDGGKGRETLPIRTLEPIRQGFSNFYESGTMRLDLSDLIINSGLLLLLNGGQLMDTQPASQAMNKQEIHFPNGNWAQAILPSAGTRITDLLHTLDIQQPDAVIIIAGGASEMDEQVHPDQVRLFTRGIAQIAASARALIIDGGTQAGVMAIIGQAVAGQQRRPTLFGVAPAGSVAYPGKPTRMSGGEGEPLDPNHSPFVLVETDEWGGETETMYELAEALSTGRPSVAVLINGGPIAKNRGFYQMCQKRRHPLLRGRGRLELISVPVLRNKSHALFQ